MAPPEPGQGAEAHGGQPPPPARGRDSARAGDHTPHGAAEPGGEQEGDGATAGHARTRAGRCRRGSDQVGRGPRCPPRRPRPPRPGCGAGGGARQAGQGTRARQPGQAHRQPDRPLRRPLDHDGHVAAVGGRLDEPGVGVAVDERQRPEVTAVCAPDIGRPTGVPALAEDRRTARSARRPAPSRGQKPSWTTSTSGPGAWGSSAEPGSPPATRPGRGRPRRRRWPRPGRARRMLSPSSRATTRSPPHCSRARGRRATASSLEPARRTGTASPAMARRWITALAGDLGIGLPRPHAGRPTSARPTGRGRGALPYQSWVSRGFDAVRVGHPERAAGRLGGQVNRHIHDVAHLGAPLALEVGQVHHDGGGAAVGGDRDLGGRRLGRPSATTWRSR